MPWSGNAAGTGMAPCRAMFAGYSANQPRNRQLIGSVVPENCAMRHIDSKIFAVQHHCSGAIATHSRHTVSQSRMSCSLPSAWGCRYVRMDPRATAAGATDALEPCRRGSGNPALPPGPARESTHRNRARRPPEPRCRPGIPATSAYFLSRCLFCPIIRQCAALLRDIRTRARPASEAFFSVFNGLSCWHGACCLAALQRAPASSLVVAKPGCARTDKGGRAWITSSQPRW